MTDAAASPTDPLPTELRIPQGRARVDLVYPDGVRSLTANALRAACRCAACTRQRHDGSLTAPTGPLTIVTLRAIGTYGVNIVFSDGHDRGIFPWSYVRSLTATGN